ncbi:MAG: MlaA family lipoprotein, partial [Sulfuricaulis sp.]|nr:MlaA family lipoprotein [Sulfuricaulis sp.]
MNAILRQLRWIVLGVAALLAACVTPGGNEPASVEGKPVVSAESGNDSDDPLEGFNRAMYTFNDTVDIYVLKPVAQ